MLRSWKSSNNRFTVLSLSVHSSCIIMVSFKFFPENTLYACSTLFRDCCLSCSIFPCIPDSELITAKSAFPTVLLPVLFSPAITVIPLSLISAFSILAKCSI